MKKYVVWKIFFALSCCRIIEYIMIHFHTLTIDVNILTGLMRTEE